VLSHHTHLLAAGYTNPSDPSYCTRIIIDEASYTRPHSLKREAQDGYFRGSVPATAPRIALTSPKRQSGVYLRFNRPV